jgi:hypothetical protein
MPSNRRSFLVTCGLAVSVTAGCTALSQAPRSHQLVGGVEWKTLRGLRENTFEKIAENKPVPTEPNVGDRAPVDLELYTVAYDKSVIDLSGPGPLTLSAEQTERLTTGYDDPSATLVLTVYNEDPIKEVPIGNSRGYRATLEQFNEVDPGDRVTVTVSQGKETVELDEVQEGFER